MDSQKPLGGQEPTKEAFKVSYDKIYKFLLIIPALMLIGAIVYLGMLYSNTGDVIRRDVTLSGGTTLTIFDDKISVKELEEALSKEFDDLVVRSLTDFSTGKQLAISLETRAEQKEIREATEKFLGYGLTEENSSIEFSGSSLSDSFYKQLIWAMVIAFVFMMITIFIIFRSPLPSIYVILSAFMDIVVTIAIVDFMGLRISTAGIAAFLMLIGYSVDTDILLTARVLKGQESTTNKRILSAFKTAMTLTASSLLAFSVAYILMISPSLKQVFLILIIGLVVDLFATWFMNASLLKWYNNKRGMV